MKCEDTYERLAANRAGELADLEQQQLQAHLRRCVDCQAIARSQDAMRLLRKQIDRNPADDLFERTMRSSHATATARPAPTRFWQGAGVGAALAASLVLAVFATGKLQLADAPATDPATIQIALGQPQAVNLAIDLERDLPGATITVMLSGGVELDGYPGERSLSWTTDLQAGVNKLTLPVVALDDLGGELLVKVAHGQRSRNFRVNLQGRS